MTFMREGNTFGAAKQEGKLNSYSIQCGKPG
jgi:hypothetical protein